MTEQFQQLVQQQVRPGRAFYTQDTLATWLGQVTEETVVHEITAVDGEWVEYRPRRAAGIRDERSHVSYFAQRVLGRWADGH